MEQFPLWDVAVFVRTVPVTPWHLALGRNHLLKMAEAHVAVSLCACHRARPKH